MENDMNSTQGRDKAIRNAAYFFFHLLGIEKKEANRQLTTAQFYTFFLKVKKPTSYNNELGLGKIRVVLLIVPLYLRF